MIENTSFNRYEQLVELADNWDIDFTVLSKDLFRGNFLRFGTPDIQIVDIEIDGHVYHRGETPKGFFTFAVLQQSSSDFIWRNTNIPQNCIMIFLLTRENNAVSFGNFKVYVISISNKLLKKSILWSGLPDPDKFIPLGDVTLNNSHKVNELRCLIKKACHFQNTNHHFLAHTQFKFLIENEIAQKLLEIIAGSNGVLPEKRNLNRKKIIEKIVDYLHTNPVVYPSVN